MKELALLLGKLMPEEFIINKLSESIERYKEAKMLNKDLKSARSELVNICMIMSINLGTDDMTTEELLKKSAHYDKLERLDPDSKQKN